LGGQVRFTGIATAQRGLRQWGHERDCIARMESYQY